jgi:hypothetical protein
MRGLALSGPAGFYIRSFPKGAMLDFPFIFLSESDLKVIFEGLFEWIMAEYLKKAVG